MNVKCAKEHISKIIDTCGRMKSFCNRHEELDDETWFIDDAVMFLADYKEVLEKAIEAAELNI